MREYWTSDFAKDVLSLIDSEGFSWDRKIPGVYPRHAEPLRMEDFYYPGEIPRGKAINFPRALEKHGTFEIRAIALWEKDLLQIRKLVLKLKKFIEGWRLSPNSLVIDLLRNPKLPQWVWFYYRKKWRESKILESKILDRNSSLLFIKKLGVFAFKNILENSIFPPESLFPELGYPIADKIIGW
jgi:hypothetical protein